MAILVRGGNASKVLPLLPIAAYSYGAILVGGWGSKSSKVLLLQPNAAHSYDAIVVMGGGYLLKNSPIAARSSSLLHGNF